jgi:hypothetical protein
LDKRLRIALYIVLVALSVWALLSLVNVVSDTRGESGGKDLFPYWFSGQYVRKGIDPYGAYLSKLESNFDINFIVGKSTTLQAESTSHELPREPALTAPILLLLTPLSYITWDVAKFIWLAINLVLVVLTPWLVFRYIEPGNLKLETVYKILLALSFWGLLATRNGVGNGQATAFVLVLMLSALLFQHQGHRLAAGVVLGVALSKYSMALPLLVLFFLWKEYRIVLYAAAVQFAGLFLLALLSTTSPISIFLEYVNMAFLYVDSPGIHLANYLPKSVALNLFITLLGFVLMVIVYLVTTRREQRLAPDHQSFTPIFQISIFLMTGLLMNYHRLYDCTMSILPMGLILLAVSHPGFFALERRHVIGLSGILAVSIAFQLMPGYAVSIVLPESMVQTWINMLPMFATTSVLALLLGNLWLYIRLTKAQPVSATMSVPG